MSSLRVVSRDSTLIFASFTSFFAFAAAFAFFFVCMFMREVNPEFPELWNPMWVVFLSIPIYYSVVGVFYKALGKFQDEDEIVNKGDIDVSKEDDDDDEDDEDDEDEDDKD